jgi:hypothetical protein
MVPVGLDQAKQDPSQRIMNMTQEVRPIHEIADEISRNWPNVYFGAVPYLRAMQYLNSINDKFGEDDAKGVILYFLSNAKTWRGDVARRIKAELKELIK